MLNYMLNNFAAWLVLFIFALNQEDMSVINCDLIAPEPQEIADSYGDYYNGSIVNRWPFSFVDRQLRASCAINERMWELRELRNKWSARERTEYAQLSLIAELADKSRSYRCAETRFIIPDCFLDY